MVIQNRENDLGEIEDHKMVLSGFGKIIRYEWDKSFEIRKELFLDEFMIMPNHLHALVVLKKIEQLNENENIVDCSVVETHGRASLPSGFHRKPKSISSFVAGFKSATTTKIDDFIDNNELSVPKYNSLNKLWQPNYYDHIVRDEEEYWKIKQYIKYNPANWDKDKFNEI